MSTRYEPKPEHKFIFGLWTVGDLGRDPFGGPVRDPKTPAELVRLLGEMGPYGVNFHDNDLIPIDATPAEAEKIKQEFRKALDETGMKEPMATTNLFYDPIFKDGAFTANDPKVRAYALQKTMNAIDLGADFGAQVYVFWGGREGVETDAWSDVPAACAATVRITGSTHPDPVQMEAYRKAYALYVELYPALKPGFEKI